MDSRRTFLRNATASGLGCGLAGVGLRPVSAAEAQLDGQSVQFNDNIEPLVQLIENTPRELLIEEVAQRVRDGLNYRKLLAALLLAGVRNVQPRPSVGFKFHAVLVVNSAHLASLASRDQDRWLPIFWALDNFKSSQARDVREGNWTMAAVDESRVPSVENARDLFVEAMDSWDVEKADVAVAGLSRTAGANEVFELFARYGVRDFRSIGHKAIFVANSYRTLQCIGWQHAEPVLRSLAYALQNHEGQPNPADSDLDADRPWRKNLERADQIRQNWQSGRLDDKATEELVSSLRTASNDDICEQIVEKLNAGVSPQSVYDALFLGAGELLMRQPGIVALHAVTSTNAFRYAFRVASNDNTRRMILLQNAAFLPMFREAMENRGDVADKWITGLSSEGAGESTVSSVFNDIGSDTNRAAKRALTYLQDGGDAGRLMEEARSYIFLKGNDSHDYKFSSAVLEDYHHISPTWRNRYLASSVFKLRGAQAKDNGLVERIRSAFV